jgi:hypothetical protein
MTTLDSVHTWSELLEKGRDLGESIGGVTVRRHDDAASRSREPRSKSRAKPEVDLVTSQPYRRAREARVLSEPRETLPGRVCAAIVDEHDFDWVIRGKLTQNGTKFRTDLRKAHFFVVTRNYDGDVWGRLGARS